MTTWPTRRKFISSSRVKADLHQTNYNLVPFVSVQLGIFIRRVPSDAFNHSIQLKHHDDGRRHRQAHSVSVRRCSWEQCGVGNCLPNI